MKYIIITCLGVLLSFTSLQSQEYEKVKQKNTNIHIELKDGVEPDIYVDGKKFDFPIELLDKDIIESIEVVKGEKAMNDYNSKNGVILITTKISSSEKNEINFKKVEGDKDKQPMVIIDGKVTSQGPLNKLSPDDIESISVVKGEQAMKKYNAANGVILVTTKKGKKKKNKKG